MTTLNNPGIVAAEVTRLKSWRPSNDSGEVPASLPRLLQSAGQAADAAKARLLAVPGDPFLFADWERVLFLHFLIAPEVLRPHVPKPFELELYEGKGCISIVALTMRNFQPCHFDLLALPFRCLQQQRFLNFRTYVRGNGESGAFFLHGLLSQPLGLPAPSNLFSLPYTFANSKYDHFPKSGMIRGNVSDGKGQFAYRASISEGKCQPADAGSLAEFAMERYSGFFYRKDRAYVFRAWHPVWLQQAVEARIERDDLITTRFPWWKEARFAGANFAPGFERVELGKAHQLPEKPPTPGGHRVLSRLFEMP